jgi:putative membrane protein
MEANMQRALGIIACAVVMAVGAPAFANTSDFMTKAIKGDNSESRLGALAMRSGHSAQVRRFGAMLVRDHDNARRQAVAVATRHRVPVPTAMADEAQAEYAKLKRMRGAAFDREFGRYMVDDHRKDIADFEKEVASRDPADVRALAQQTLPALRRHLAAARAIG